jgi:LPXTG-site transpeptidase (sortase) family protein
LKTNLATSQLGGYRYLQSVAEIRGPLPTIAPKSPAEESPPLVFLPVIQKPDPDESLAAQPVEVELPAGVRPGPSAGPVVRIVIPGLRVDRTVVPVGLKRNSSRQLEWNTDALFSTANRPDLVGQIEASVNPGDGGNIVLMGHNYNNGWYANAGVFVNLQNLKPGGQIILYTQDGSEFHYIVQVVKKIPWQKQNAAELEKHQKYLWPTEHEQVTLVTCGGANILNWSARIYVVATPDVSAASN